MKTQQVELDELTVREVKVQEIRSVEASLRVDAIASAGFRLSRGKIADMVKAGDVRSVKMISRARARCQRHKLWLVRPACLWHHHKAL